MKKVKRIDVTSLDIEQSVEHSFDKKDVYVKSVEIKDANKIIITRRNHREKGYDFLSVYIFENNIERAMLTTDFGNVELTEYPFTLYFEVEKIDKKRDPLKGI